MESLIQSNSEIKVETSYKLLEENLGPRNNSPWLLALALEIWSLISESPFHFMKGSPCLHTCV